jgi:hypothetical protein
VDVPVADVHDDRPDQQEHGQEEREEDRDLATLMPAAPLGALLGGG